MTDLGALPAQGPSVPGAATANGAGQQSDRYTLTDRRSLGYKGRWRYRLVLPAFNARTLFTRRADAAGFASVADARGWGHALAFMDACGNRPGIDFKDDR